MATEAMITPSGTAGHSFVEWGPIIGGTVLSLAVSAVLLQFGAALGLAADAPLRGDGVIAAWGVIASGLWLMWVQFLASMSGGYMAGRLRAPVQSRSQHEREVRDGTHGLLVWATGTVVMIVATTIASTIGAVAVEQMMAADETPAVENVEQNTAVIFAFVATAAFVVSALAAWWAAVKGGEHRDKHTDFSRHISFGKGPAE